jgi:hypothetical protein
MKTGNSSRQDAKNAKFGSLFSLRPLPFDCAQGGEFIEPRLCERYSDFLVAALPR